MKVLFFDLETAPLLAYIWSPYDDYVTHDRLIKGGFLLTWSAQWRGTSKIMSGCVTGAEAIAQDDRRIVVELAALIREADIICAHNVDKFDLPVFNTRLLAHKQPPLGPVKTVDTLKIAKRAFRLPYNKLDYLADFLFADQKLKTSFQLWKDCYHGNEKALAKMLRYNRKDVGLLAKVFEALLPYAKNLPRLQPLAADDRCTYCGSADLSPAGYHYTPTADYNRDRCNGCDRYGRRRMSERRISPLTVGL